LRTAKFESARFYLPLKDYASEDSQDASFQDLQLLSSLQICSVETFLLNDFLYTIDE